MVTPVSVSPLMTAQLMGAAPPVLRQQGRVDVDAPHGRQIQDVVRQDAAVGRHHDELRVQLLQLGQSGPVPELGGLKDRNAVLQRRLLHRRGLELVLVPAHRLIRLAEHPAHRVPRLNEPLQGGDGKVGGAHKDDSHASSSCSSSSSSSSVV